jgi:5-formyltetrahydrofolate cyclo-ligase
MTVQKQKQQLRKEMLAKLSSISKEQHIKKSQSIASHLYEQREWQEARAIGITLSMSHEVDTYAIIEQAWMTGKRVAVPKCNRQTRTMTFRYITSYEQLEVVYMNLREPIPEATLEAKAAEMDLLIVPGLACTEHGERLGYGGGYYDRYLSSYNGHTIALVFKEQIISKLPIEPNDRLVQKVITDESVFTCS